MLRDQSDRSAEENPLPDRHVRHIEIASVPGCDMRAERRIPQDAILKNQVDIKRSIDLQLYLEMDLDGSGRCCRDPCLIGPENAWTGGSPGTVGRISVVRRGRASSPSQSGLPPPHPSWVSGVNRNAKTRVTRPK